MHRSYLIISCVVTWSVILLWLLHVAIPAIKTTSSGKAPLGLSTFRDAMFFKGRGYSSEIWILFLPPPLSGLGM